MPEKCGGVITTDHLDFLEETDPRGQITMTLQVGKEGDVEPVEPLIRGILPKMTQWT